MNAELLERAIRLWKQAFVIRRRLPKSLAACEDVRTIDAWLRHEQDLLPVPLRPAAADREALVRMLTSFAATSFNQRAFTLRAPFKGKKARAKAATSAVLLQIYALEALAAEQGLEVSSAVRESLAAGNVPKELTLLTYAHELVRRTEYASQGASVYWLWLELDEKTRNGLTVESVQQAEQRLLDWLNCRPVETATTD
jgi:hypothetical protein